MRNSAVLEHREAAASAGDRLDALLAEPVAAAIRRERRAFDQSASPFERRLVLFGAGALGRKTAAGLRRAGVEPLAFADNNPARWGTAIDGLPVLSPSDAAAQFGANAAFVIAIWNGNAGDRMCERVRQLNELGCARVIPAGILFWKYPDVFLPNYPLDLPHKVLEQAEHVRAAFRLWEDEESRREYVAQVEFRLHLNYDGLRPPDPHHYFASNVYRLTAGETLIDCGAFDGDTIRSFIGLRGEGFTRILAFEPDPLNWRKLEQTVAALAPGIRNRIRCFPHAVGAAPGYIAFEPTGTVLSMSGTGNSRVECTTIDIVARGERPTILKFDIEGAEPDALEGARGTIREHHPILAVSAYHLQHHLWEIPLQIARLHAGYRYALRPHGTEAWDLVCYAVPRERE